MTDILVHGVPGSPFTRAALMALVEKGRTFRFSPVRPGTLRDPEHLARHPFGRVPVIEHDGVVLYETQAILRYLDRVFPDPALTPADPVAAARMDQVMNVSDWYLFQGVGNVVGFERIVKPMLLGAPADETAVAAALPKASTVFAELARLLGGRPFFAGDTVSLADLLVAPHLDMLAMTPEWAALAGPNPTLEAWLQRMRGRPSFAQTGMDEVATMAKS